MYRYYQLHGKGVWQPIDASSRPEEEVIGQVLLKGGRKLTILSVSDLVDESTDKKALKYKGPLYFDIDDKDLNVSITSARALVQKLTNLGLVQEDIRIFCSGSKGFHVLIDQRCFSNGRAVLRLPAIYKVIARELYVTGLDMQVYSEGRGNSFRLPNLLREDGNYRIAITHEELYSITPELYRTMTSAPRDIEIPAPAQLLCTGLEVLFRESQKEVGSRPATQASATAEELTDIKAVIPPCVQSVMSGGDKTVSFNQMAMQVSCYMSRAGISEDSCDTIIARTAANNTGSASYSTEVSRVEHLRAQLEYSKAVPTQTFSCGGMKSVAGRVDCQSCPVYGRRLESGTLTRDVSGLVERQDGYYQRLANGNEKFIFGVNIKPQSVFIDIPLDGSSPRRTAAWVNYYVRGKKVGHGLFQERAWTSRSAFLAELSGIGGAESAFFGSDQDVQRIKMQAFTEMEDLDEIKQVHSCGIHVDSVDDNDIFVYVEPSWSVDRFKVSGTHKLSASNVHATPQLSKFKLPAKSDEKTDEALWNLMQINEPFNVARILGWFVACHFKAHIYQVYQQYPFLNLWGGSGAGKSKTASLMSALNGVIYDGRCSTANVSNITSFAAIEYAASSTTVPRLMEEFNKSKMTERMYNLVGEIIKSSWGGESVLRGTLGSRSTAGRTGAVVQDIPITGPLCVLNEQAVSMPAHLERAVLVKLSKRSKAGKSRYVNRASLSRRHIAQFGKALMLTALNTSLEDVVDLMDEFEAQVPENLDDRPRFSMQVVMFGLKMYERALNDMGMTKALQQMPVLWESVTGELRSIAADESLSHTRTEVDAVLEALGLMVEMSQIEGAPSIFMFDGWHYEVAGDDLMLNMPTCLVAYKKFMHDYERSKPAIVRNDHFKQLIEDEPYFNGFEQKPDVLQGKPHVRLSLGMMDDKGIDAELFRGN